MSGEGGRGERTLSIVKPDGVRKGLIGEVIRRFEKEGIRISAMRMIRLTRGEAEGFYAVHRDRPFFGSLTEFIWSRRRHGAGGG
jgi:nucleoside-diphosphate kinase